MSRNIIQFFKNLYHSISVRVSLMMIAMGIIIYLTFVILTSRNEVLFRSITRMFYIYELKFTISQQYLYSIDRLPNSKQDIISDKFEFLLNQGYGYQYITQSSDSIEEEAVNEFLQLYALAEQARKYPNQRELLSSVYQESLEYPTDTFYRQTINSIVQYTRNFALDHQIVAAILFISLFSAYVVLFLIARRIGKITQMTKLLVNNDSSLQLTERIHFNSHDEMKEIVDHINIFMDMLERQTVHLMYNSKGLVHQINKMFDSSQGWMLETKVLQNSTERVAQQMSEQILSVNQSAAALDEMERTLEVIFNNISRQSSAMSQSASTLEEMGRQVEGVANIAADTAGLAVRLTEVASKGNKAVDASVVSIQDVAEYSSQILKLLQLISSIAKQTNLLAMNASIEAAHAGDAGRGFAIVAEEIRRLSETTNKNAKEIKTVVDTMVDKIENSVSQARVAGEDLHQINQYSENVAERIEKLNVMMQQQNTATHEMIATIEGLVTLAQEIKLSMEEQQFGLHEYSNTITDLRGSFAEVKSTLDSHMSSVNNLLNILIDVGIRIAVQKRIMGEVTYSLDHYKIADTIQENSRIIQEQQDKLYLEEKLKYDKLN